MTSQVNCDIIPLIILRERSVNMEIDYSSNKLKKILEDELLIKKYYTNICTQLKNRLTELRTADCLKDIPETPPPRRHKLTGNKNEKWGISVSKNQRLILEPDGDYDINDLTTIKSI